MLICDYIKTLFLHRFLGRYDRFQMEAWHDVALAKNVICFRPTKPVDWDEIAAKLSEAFSAAKGKLVELKGRGCRERMDIRNAI